MNNELQTLQDKLITRREMLHRGGMGMGALALAQLAGSTAEAQQLNSVNPLAPKQPHFPAKAKRVIHLFMNGGPSHVDTFDPKPMLDKYDGKPLPIHLKTERKTGAGFASPFKFQKYGQSGTEVSELFPNVAKWVDEMCVIRSMRTELPNHEPSLYLMNCGEQRQVRPSLGSWVTYGLGSENQNLPGFVVMTPFGYPTAGAQSWTSAFLPGVYQGAFIDPNETDVERLVHNIRNNNLNRQQQREQLDLLTKLNRRYQQKRHEESVIEAQIQNYELAFRMQTEATEAFDLSKEPEHIRKQYGSSAYGRQLLLARRLLERGVRFVQCWQGKGQPWDSHDNLPTHHRNLARITDQPIAALLEDLKQRGMLDDTLVIWGGEFGRTPTVELTGHIKKEEYGRDHNPYGFTVWMAGAGVKKGYVHGATDEFGFRAVENTVHVHDLHATILHLLGFDHEKLTYRYAGRDFRLTDVSGLVVNELMA